MSKKSEMEAAAALKQHQAAHPGEENETTGNEQTDGEVNQPETVVTLPQENVQPLVVQNPDAEPQQQPQTQDEPDETISGGRYIVGGRTVDANGKELQEA